ncbi:MAG: nickel pincer cofactor biosynthesis protein LarC [Campylobacter sp.]|nr:nickel pincer cofactor biosynthesis protein LarC [Campylobacter sp.]
MAKILYYDASSGISGDMNLGALVDLGADFSYLCAELEKLNLAGEFHLEKCEILKSGVRAVKINVIATNASVCSRNFESIKKIVLDSNLSEFVKGVSLDIFQTIAEAEAKIHGTSAQNVHFHEIGAIDSIVDIVGAAICFEALNKSFAPTSGANFKLQIYSSDIELGGGTVRCEHGGFSVPAPATAEILRGMPVSLGRSDFEMTTPTGAAILRTCALNFTSNVPAPNKFKILRIGYGAGGKDAQGFANVLRVMLCEDACRSQRAQTQILIETNIDDMDAESLAYACEILRENGALDVFSEAVYMKKGRVGVKLSVLCHKEDAAKFKELVFAHTSAIGVREIEVRKTELAREFTSVDTKFGKIGLKISLAAANSTTSLYESANLKFAGANEKPAATLNLNDGENLAQAGLKIKPEFKDCKAAAAAHGVTIAEVRKAALKAYDEIRKFKK